MRLVLAAALLLSAARARAGAPARVLAVALEADDAAALCPAPACSLADFWDRARAMGVTAAVVRERPLKRLAERGEVLHITREEFEKWKVLGLLAPGAVLKPDTLWIKDDAVLRQVLEAVERRGVSVSTSSMAGYNLVEFPEGYASVEESLGVYDSEALDALRGRKLAVIRVGRDAEGAEAYLAGLSWRPDGQVEGRGGLQAPASFDALLHARVLPVDAPAGAFVREAWSHPQRLLDVRLPAAPGREADFELLRARLRTLAQLGPSAGLPASAPRRPGPPSAAWLLSAALWLLACLGGLLSARAGLAALKRSRAFAQRALPVASPVLELLLGVCAMVLAAQLFGLAARACLDALGRPLASGAWLRAAVAAPIVIGVLTLYTLDPEDLSRRARRPATWRQLFLAAAGLAAAAVVLEPRAVLQAAGASAWLARLEDASPRLWWATWRWREVLVGFPCLLYAFFLIDWRLECPDCLAMPKGASGDPRTWFLPGLLAPAGVLGAAARGGVGPWTALAHSALAAAAGSLLGALLIGWRVRRSHHAGHGSKVPGPNRTIVPES